MKQKTLAAVLAALAVVVAGVVLSFFFTGRSAVKDQITLPGIGSAVVEAGKQLSSENREKVEALRVDRTNVQTLIATLSRPETYRCRIEITYAFADSSAVLAETVWKSGRLLRISQQDAQGEPDLQALLSDQWVYLWKGGGAYQRFPRQPEDEDLYARAPGWETLLSLPQKRIRSGGTRELGGRLCIVAETDDPALGQRTEWSILADSGLLLLAETYEGERLVYRAEMTELSLEPPEENLFRLPDGASPD